MLRVIKVRNVVILKMALSKWFLALRYGRVLLVKTGREGVPGHKSES